MGLIAGSQSPPGGGHNNPLQYSRLKNPTDRGAWWATVHRVTESDTTEATVHAGIKGAGRESGTQRVSTCQGNVDLPQVSIIIFE